MLSGLIIQFLSVRSLNFKFKRERRPMEDGGEARGNCKSWQLWIFLAAELIWNAYFVFGVFDELTLRGIPHGAKVNDLWILIWVWLIGNLALACVCCICPWVALVNRPGYSGDSAKPGAIHYLRGCTLSETSRQTCCSR